MKDKTAFVVGLLAAVLALSPYQTLLENQTIDMGFANISIWTLVLISIGLLLISTYFFALQFVKDGISYLDKWQVFKYFEVVGNAIYILAVISPFLYFIFWGINKLLTFIPNIDKSIYVFEIASILAALLSFILSLRNEVLRKQKQVEIRKESLENEEIKSAKDARLLVEKRLWSLSIIEAYRSLESSITKNLLRQGFDIKRLPFYRALDILVQRRIISKDDLQQIQYIRNLRNKAAHSSIENTEEEAKEVLNITNSIILKIEFEPTVQNGHNNNILSVLISSKGLFPKSAIKLLNPVNANGFDARARGPYHRYYINFLYTTNEKIISKAVENCKVHSDQEDRFILIVPHQAYPIEVDFEKIKVLYFDPETASFVNREELLSWIMKK